jgi:hypothetical protein
MNEHAVRMDIEQDVQDAVAGRGRVLYLEGKTDVGILLALLGTDSDKVPTRGVLHDGVLLRALGGSSTVARYLEVAQKYAIPRIFGVLDGDGDPLTALAAEFDPPHPGPRFRWKGYCIENLLARASWPPAWGPPPGWPAVLASFAPYVAVNRLGADLLRRLNRLGLDRLINPTSAQDPRTVDAFLELFRAGKHELAGLEIEAMFSAELAGVLAVFAAGLDQAHTIVNGKWLVDAFAARHTRRPAPLCRDEWTGHLRATGGDPEILAWWRRTIAA